MEKVLTTSWQESLAYSLLNIQAIVYYGAGCCVLAFFFFTATIVNERGIDIWTGGPNAAAVWERASYNYNRWRKLNPLIISISKNDDVTYEVGGYAISSFHALATALEESQRDSVVVHVDPTAAVETTVRVLDWVALAGETSAIITSDTCKQITDVWVSTIPNRYTVSSPDGPVVVEGERPMRFRCIDPDDISLPEICVFLPPPPRYFGEDLTWTGRIINQRYRSQNPQPDKRLCPAQRS